MIDAAPANSPTGAGTPTRTSRSPRTRIAVARRIVESLAAVVEAKQKPWRVKFRKGYVAFQRAGGLNVILVDLYWNKPVRLAISSPQRTIQGH